MVLLHRVPTESVGSMGRWGLMTEDGVWLASAVPLSAAVLPCFAGIFEDGFLSGETLQEHNDPYAGVTFFGE